MFKSNLAPAWCRNWQLKFYYVKFLVLDVVIFSRTPTTYFTHKYDELLFKNIAWQGFHFLNFKMSIRTTEQSLHPGINPHLVWFFDLIFPYGGSCDVKEDNNMDSPNHYHYVSNFELEGNCETIFQDLVFQVWPWEHNSSHYCAQTKTIFFYIYATILCVLL